jgi:hypothetical protein
MVAAYAAIVATVTAVVQAVNLWRDRVRVKITVQHNMGVFGDSRYENMTLTALKAINVGRRPVTITGMGACYLYSSEAFVCTDTNPKLPCELTEGKCVTSLLDEENLNLTNLQSWQAWDSAGRLHNLHIAPWHKRWKSKRQRRKAATKVDPAKTGGAAAP